MCFLRVFAVVMLLTVVSCSNSETEVPQLDVASPGKLLDHEVCISEHNYRVSSASFEPNTDEKDAVRALNEIAEKLGTVNVPKLVPCNFASKARTYYVPEEIPESANSSRILAGEYIVYNPDWIRELLGDDLNALYALFGHELGHFINRDFTEPRIRTFIQEKERDADWFAGCALGLTDRDFVSAETVLRKIREKKRAMDYPPINESLEAAYSGYQSCKRGQVALSLTDELSQAEQLGNLEFISKSGRLRCSEFFDRGQMQFSMKVASSEQYGRTFSGATYINSENLPNDCRSVKFSIGNWVLNGSACLDFAFRAEHAEARNFYFSGASSCFDSGNESEFGASGANGTRIRFALQKTGDRRWTSEADPIDARSTAANYRAPVVAQNVEDLDDFSLFRDCETCPEMIIIPAGAFVMGYPIPPSPEHGDSRNVSLQRFAVSRFEITWDEWQSCVQSQKCNEIGLNENGGDHGWGRGNRPVVNVSKIDAENFAEFVTNQVGHVYSLPSESQWEYIAKAGEQIEEYVPDALIDSNNPNVSEPFGTYAQNYEKRLRSECLEKDGSQNDVRECEPKTVSVEASIPNEWGVYGSRDNISEWVSDCHTTNLSNVDMNGEKKMTFCLNQMYRGQSWLNHFFYFRPHVQPEYRSSSLGFRLVRRLAD